MKTNDLGYTKPAIPFNWDSFFAGWAVGLLTALIVCVVTTVANAQKGDPAPTTKEPVVLKVDSTERLKIEQWTLQNTFPDIIVFIKDADGNYVVGKEVLSDPAYEKLGVFDGQKTESLASYLDAKTDTTTYRPKVPPDDGTKTGTTITTK